METGDDTLSCSGFPGWVPEEACRYLAHTVTGVSIRALARGAGCHASTVLRQVRKFEARRDDLLVDHALRRLGRTGKACHAPRAAQSKESPPMTMTASAATGSHKSPAPDDVTVEREARRILRRLNEPGACLAVAPEMEKAVVVREGADGQTVRTGVVDRAVAEALALKDWITSRGIGDGRDGSAGRNPAGGRIVRYRITATGRIALKRLIAQEDAARAGFAEAGAAFGHQHREFAEREDGGAADQSRRRLRYNAAESPLVALSRRRERNGAPFLGDDLVAAGERLREDFELAQMGPRTTQNWDKFLTAGASAGFGAGDGGMAEGPRAARERVSAALADLGPGLGDVVLRCCCFLEGMEAAERRMGWSARSGKIVLRIALQRLKRHYDAKGGWSPLIG